MTTAMVSIISDTHNPSLVIYERRERERFARAEEALRSEVLLRRKQTYGNDQYLALCGRDSNKAMTEHQYLL